MNNWQTEANILNNQPNDIIIGCGKYRSEDIVNTPFHHLSRMQQLEAIREMLEDGVDEVDLQTELYLVAHYTLGAVRESFLF